MRVPIRERDPMPVSDAGRVQLTADDYKRLDELRRIRGEARERAMATVGERLADRVAATVGSWRFIAVQSAMLVVWLTLNVTAYIAHWDPYPFILLNLVLSFQAAYTAPVIMMSQNRQSDIDRERARDDYDVNIKAELEIELLHQKIDMLREQEIGRLTTIIEELLSRLNEAAAKPR